MLSAQANGKHVKMRTMRTASCVVWLLAGDQCASNPMQERWEGGGAQVLGQILSTGGISKQPNA
jgi:hypothetical protein